MRKGFTLIEIVVAVSLMTAMSGVMMAQYNQYNRRQTIESVTDRMAQVFTEAKVNALSGKKDCYVCGGTDYQCNNQNDNPLLGWRVQINPPGVTRGYRIQGICTDISGAEVPFMIREQQFPDNVDISTLSETEVTFYPLNGGTDLNESLYVTVTGNSGETSEFMVSQGGEVVPPLPTNTPTLVPTTTSTPVPTPTPSSCSSVGGKCVPQSDACYPQATVSGTCAAGYKCVAVAAQCGNYTCGGTPLVSCRNISCSGGYAPYPSGGTCPSGWVCCRYLVGGPTPPPAE